MVAKISDSEYRRRVKAASSGNIVPLESYTNARTKILVKCKRCSHEWSVLPSVSFGGFGCPKCYGKLYITEDEYRRRMPKLFGDTIELVRYRQSGDEPVQLRCRVCNTEFERKITEGNRGCPTCGNVRRTTSGLKLKPVKLGNRTVRVQGNEPEALAYVVACGANPKKIAINVDEGKPVIKYRFDKKQRIYIPDFFYAPKNRIVEVKSIWTLGLKGYSQEFFRKNVAKARACIAQGFDFSLLLFDSKGHRVFIPKNWYELSRTELQRIVKENQNS